MLNEFQNEVYCTACKEQADTQLVNGSETESFCADCLGQRILEDASCNKSVSVVLVEDSVGTITATYQ